jgi:hypothetical protein
MSFTIKNLAQEGNAETKPNEVFSFGYPVLNLDGSIYIEPLLVDVEVAVYELLDPVAKKVFNFANGGTSHTVGTNIIALQLDIKDSELPTGNYTWSINHKRNINGTVRNNVMFAGDFKVTDKPNCDCDITECNVGNINIVNVDGLRAELDLRMKYTTIDIPYFAGTGENDDRAFTVIGGDFINKPPIVQYLSNGQINNPSVAIDINILTSEIILISSSGIAIPAFKLIIAYA